MKVQVTWDPADEQFHEVPVAPRLSARQLERRRREIASMIVDQGLTVREIAGILGIHNCNVYRAVAGLCGGKFSEVPEAWAENKRQAGPRAHASRRARKSGG